MNNRILILVPSTWNDTDRGKYFEDLVADLFRQMQFKVTERVRVTGMEIDLMLNIYTAKKWHTLSANSLQMLLGRQSLTN